MTRAAADAIESYITRLHAELSAAGAADVDDVTAEVRSLLVEAAGDDEDAASIEIERLGEPVELAQGILAERGLDASSGISSGVWWRLGIAAPVDIAIGLAVPLAAAVPLYMVALSGGVASIAVAIALGAAALAWPFFVWRPWRTGGAALSPGMTLTHLAVVRAPGFWRPVRISELEAMGLAPRRHLVAAIVITVAAAVLIASTLVWLSGEVLRQLAPLGGL